MGDGDRTTAGNLSPEDRYYGTIAAEEALQQIKDKNYQLQFFGDALATRESQGESKTFIIGVNFSRETRTIDRWVIE